MGSPPRGQQHARSSLCSISDFPARQAGPLQTSVTHSWRTGTATCSTPCLQGSRQTEQLLLYLLPRVFAAQVRKGASDLYCFVGFTFVENKKQWAISLYNGLLLSLYGKQTGQFFPTGKTQHLHLGWTKGWTTTVHAFWDSVERAERPNIESGGYIPVWTWQTGVVTHAVNPSPQKAEEGRSMSLKPANLGLARATL